MATKDIEGIINITLGSYIGKIFCIGLSLISFYISTHLIIPNALKEKYDKKAK